MKKQTGWLVRDPKGRVVKSYDAIAYCNRGTAIHEAWQNRCDYVDLFSVGDWWVQAQKDGYTVEKVAL